jgi:glycosyltransferase involved in cell wall biosynthesis
LDQLDVYVQPSVYEGGPYVPLEAMRAGTPVVVSDAVGNRDVVEAGCSGLVVPVGDQAALAAAVHVMLADPDAARAMTDRARARIAERFDVRQMGDALRQLYVGLGSGQQMDTLSP